MKLLQDILYKSGIEERHGTLNLAVAAIAFDSREVKKDSLFVAVKGTLTDGHQYIDQAIGNGAVAVVCEHLPAHMVEGVSYIRVKNSEGALSHIAANFYDNPSEKLKLVAVTGTNGKTTVATLLYKLFQQLGYKTGLLSTVAYRIDKEVISASHTTPDAIRINAYLAKMVEQGCKYCFMEASSHGIVQARTAGLHFVGAAFTNISRDHLDYHKTFDDYILAKKQLFDELDSDAFALSNKDDRHGQTMLHHTKGRKSFYALQKLADYKGRVVENDFTGLFVNLNGQDLYTKLCGSFNAYNLLTVYGVAMELGEDSMNVLTILSNLSSVEGRFEQFRSDTGIVAIVDYAHTPDALKNVLNTINDIREGAGKLITLVGCGGDRDKGKRPMMAKIACEKSDQVVFTSDNPRSEEPMDIIADMKAALDPVHERKTLSMPDRAEAIKLAVNTANSGDVILIAGKGHEKYQEIKGVRHDFDDMEVVKQLFKLFEK
jgi:UDP-N-acetylmuramoyl-L-alanyl-D-glutamate--2,6-diaminopimelate ligase